MFRPDPANADTAARTSVAGSPSGAECGSYGRQEFVRPKRFEQDRVLGHINAGRIIMNVEGVPGDYEGRNTLLRCPVGELQDGRLADQ